MTDRITLRRPDDWHLHLRDGDMLAAVAAYSGHFGRAIIMPNLVPPEVTGAQAAAYRDRILAVLPENVTLRPLMTLYLTETTDPADIVSAHSAGIIAAVKLYPAGATTNSASGVRDFDKVRPVLEAMAEAGIPLCTHGEVTDPAVDIFDREAVFIDRIVGPALAPFAQACLGTLVRSERDAIRGDDPTSRVSNDRQNAVGTCGNFGFCASGYRACYTCVHFQPWLDAPHSEVLEDLYAEKLRVKEAGCAEVVVNANDLLILAVEDCVSKCAAMRQQLAGASCLAEVADG